MKDNIGSMKLITVLAILAAAIHVWYLFPLPMTAADSVLNDLTARGTTIPQLRQQEMRDELYSMFVFNRLADALLAVFAITIAIATRRDAKRTAVAAAALYSMVNVTFLLIGWGVFEHGAQEIMGSQFSRLAFQFRSGAMLPVIEQIGRLFTFAMAMVIAIVLCVMMVRRMASPPSAGPLR